MIKNKRMKYIKEVARIIFGLTFIFSGIVKGIDPLGSTYKFTDYFVAFGTEWATSLALILSFVIPFIEFAIGIALTLKYHPRIFSCLGFIFMSFFLPFTLFIAIKNPVTDCGCFGDAIILDNWDTFYKNIILFVLAAIILLYRNQYKNKYNIHFQNGYFVFFSILFFTLTLYSYNHLPILDFRPYKVGTDIEKGMEIPENAPQAEYENEFIYRNKKSGKEKEFNENNYPWKDTINWEFVSINSKRIKEGYVPPIHNFTIETPDGEDFTDYFLNEEKPTFLLIAYDLTKSKTRRMDKINDFANQTLANGNNFICLTASTQRQIDAFKNEFDTQFDYFFCDEITLKTIIRSNPGLVYLENGVILNKWHWRDIPK